MITQEQIRRARAKGFSQSLYFQKTLPQVLQGEAALTFQAAGIPPAGAYDGNLNAKQFIGDRAALSHASGLLTLNPATSPEKNLLSFFRGLNASSNPSGIFYLVDMLVEYCFNGNTGPAAQATGSALGATDIPRYTDGEDVQIVTDVITALGVTTRGVTFDYTDQDGNTGTTVSVNTVVSQAAIQTINNGNPFIPLAANDRGVKSIQSCTIAVGGTGAGTFAAVLVKRLATIRAELSSGLIEYDGVNLQEALAELPEDCCPALFWVPTTTNTLLLSLAGEAITLDPDDLDA